MPSSNRLELDIVANDRTGPEAEKSVRNFKSIESEAAKAAQGMSRSFDAGGVELVRSIERASAGASKALESLERRAALVGKTGVEKLLTQRSLAIGGAGGDEAAIQRIVGSYDKLIGAQQRLDRSRAQSQTRSTGIAAGQAVLPGAAGFDAALAKVQEKDRAIADLQRRSRLSGTDAIGRLAIEENEALKQLGKTPADIDRIRTSFAKLRQDATPAARSIADSLDDIGNRATRVGGTLAILSIPLAIGAKHAIDLASNLEAARVGFIATSGSATAADKHIQALRTFSEKTPFEFRELIDQSRYLEASGFKQDDVIPVLRSFGNAVALNGGGQEALQRVLLQVGQIKATDRATFEDVKPILQAGVPILDVLGESIRKKGQSAESAKAEARKGLSDGRFSADQFFAVTNKAFTTGKYTNALENESALIIGQLSNLQDKVDSIFTSIGQGASATVSRAISGIAQPILSEISDIAEGFKTLPQPIKDVVVALGAMTIAAPGALFAAGSLSQVVAFAFKGLESLRGLLVTGFGGALATLVPSLGGLSFALLAVGAAVAVIYTEFERAKGAFKDTSADFDKFLKGKVDSGDINETRKLLEKARGGGDSELSVISPERYKELKLQLDDRQNTEIGNQFKSDLEKKGIVFIPKDPRKPAGGTDAEAKAISRHQTETLRNSRSLLNRSTFSPDAGRDLRAELEKASTFTDKDGNLRHLTLFDGTRRNLLAAFANYTRDVNLKTSRSQIESEKENYERRKAFETELWQKRQEFALETARLQVATDDKVYAHQNDLAGYSRDERLGGLAGENPQTLAGKLALERKRLGIETDYLTTTAVNNAAAIDRQKERDILANNGDYSVGKIGSQEFSDRRNAIEAQAAQAATELNDKYGHDVIAAQQEAANASVRIVRDAQLREFDSLRSSVEGVLAAAETKGISVFQAIGNAAKSALLGAFNQVVSAQVAAGLFRILNPGATIGFDATGKTGVGKVLGSLGLGTSPRFGGGSKLDQPGHLGDVNLIQNAVPVVIVGQSQAAQRQSGGGFGVPALGGLARLAATIAPLLGVARTISTGGGVPAGAIDSTISYEGGGSESFSSIVGGSGASGGGSFGTESLGIPGGYGFPSAGGLGAPGGSGGSGGPGGLLSGVLGKGGLKGIAGNLNQFIGGAFHAGNTVGLAGNLSQLAKSPAGLLAGGALAFDGLRRGGALGTLETTAGGALIGFKYGGPLGAGIGAAIGLGAGLLREFVFKGPKEKIKAEVKRVYGLEISDGIADQIQQIAKQSYGGDWRVAIRSQQVRDLIKLYSQTIGSDAQKQFVNDTIHSASLSESGGRLTQNAIYDNGQAYSYQSVLGVTGDIQTSSLSTSARGSGSPSVNVHLDKDATVDLIRTGSLQGIQSYPRAVASAAVSGYGASAGRAGNASMALAPSVISQ